MGINSQDTYASLAFSLTGIYSEAFPDDLLDGYPLVNVYITIWKDTPFFYGKTHYFYGHFQ